MKPFARSLRLTVIPLLLVALLCASTQNSASTNQQEKPELVLQSGHSLRVDGLAFSPDGRYLASAGADATIKIWDAETGHELRSLSGHAGGVRSVAFSANGQTLASGGVDGKIKLWDVAAGREVATLNGHQGRINALAFSRDGRLLASGAVDNTVRLWDVAARAELRILAGHSGWVLAVAFSPNGQTLASGSADKTIKLWDTASGRELQSLTGHNDAVTTLAFNPQGDLLASGSADATARLWRLQQGTPAQNFNLNAGRVLAVGFNPDGRELLVGTMERAIKRFDAANGRELQTFNEPARLEKYETLAFSPDGQTFALCPGTRAVEVRSLPAGTETRTLVSRVNAVKAIAYSPDGRWFATGNQDTSMTLWDVFAGRAIANLPGNTGSINAVTFSPDGLTLAAGSYGGVIRLWDVVAANPLKQWPAHEDGINALLFTRDGKRLISASVDQTIKIWDAATGGLLNTLKGHAQDVTALSLSADGKWLASASADGTVKIWDVTTGQPARTLTGHSGAVFAVVFSNAGNRLASGGTDKTVRIWDVNSGQTTRTLIAPTSATSEGAGNAIINSLAFNDDDSLLAAGDSGAVIRLWSLTSEGAPRLLSGHSGSVNGLTFDDDGKWLLSGSDDGSVRVWESATGAAAATLVSLRESGNWLAVAPDGLFDGAPAAWNQILWRFGRNTFNAAPVEIFFNEYFYPELLADVLAGKRPRARQEITQRDRRQPRVKILIGNETSVAKLAPPATVNARTITVKLEVGAARDSGAGDVRLFRNGLLVKVWRGDVLQGGERKTLECQIPIIAGENRLTAYAFNKDNIKSADETRLIIGADEFRRRGTAYLLAIGINQYANREYNLRYAVNDAQDFSAELRRQQLALNQFAHIEVVSLLNEQATKANIAAALQRLAGVPLPATAPTVLQTLKPVQPEDALIVYFAGHGFALDTRFYLIPHDLGYTGKRAAIDQSALQRVLARSISDLELEALLEGIDAGQLLFVLDACQSAQVFESEEKRRGPMNVKGLAQLAYEKGVYILAAAQNDQPALENPQLGHGYLTYALVELGLRKMEADGRPRDGQVLIREWLDHATEKVPRMQEAKYQAERKRLLLTRLKLKVKPEAQRPRVFYRREAEAQPLIIAKSPGASVNK